MCELRRIKSIAPSNGNGFLSALWETLVVSIAIIVLLMLGNAEMVSVKSENVPQKELFLNS